MEIPSNASKIQSYDSHNGIKFASSEGSSASSTSRLKEATSYSKVEKSKEQATEAAFQLAQHRQELNDEERVKMVEEVNEFISSHKKGIAFKVDEESGRDVVTIYETTTGDIIRQIPDEEMLEILRRLAAQNSNSRIFEVKA